MLSFTQRQTRYQEFTNDSSTTNNTFGNSLMNEAEKRIVNTRAWDFTQRELTRTTVASQANYKLHVNYRKLLNKPTITVGSIKYLADEISDRAEFDLITSVVTTSDIPQRFYIFNKEINFYPAPSTSGNTIGLPIEIQSVDMSIADDVVGTATVVNAGTTVTGIGTSWNNSMVGRYIQLATNTVADSSGDNEWYEVASVTTTTAIELNIPYQGPTITTATTLTIAERSILPDGYDLLPVYHASHQYFIKTSEPTKATWYKSLYDDLIKEMISDRGTKTSNLAIESRDNSIKNPNLYVN